MNYKGLGGGGLVNNLFIKLCLVFSPGLQYVKLQFQKLCQGSWRGKNKNDVKNHTWNAMLVHLGHFIFQFVSRLGLTCALSDQLKIHVNLQM